MNNDEFRILNARCNTYKYLDSKLCDLEKDLETLDTFKEIHIISDGTINRNICPRKQDDIQKDLFEAIRGVYEKHIIKTKLEMENI